MRAAILIFIYFLIQQVFSQNSVLNPGYENALNNWITYTTDAGNCSLQIDNTVAHTGSNSFKISINPNGKIVTGLSTQWIQLKPGAHYIFESYIKTDAVLGNAAGNLIFLQNNKRLFGDATIKLRGTLNWQKVQARFYLPSKCDTVQLIMGVSSMSGTTWIDDVSIRELTDTSSTQFSVDISNLTGKTIKPFMEVNVGPLSPPYTDNWSTQFQDLGIDMVRTHDYQNYVTDISKIFPDTSRNPFDSTAYYFLGADSVIKAIIDGGMQVYFRLGESGSLDTTKYNPPLDYNKWAQVCVQIVKHFNNGWDKGFQYGIKYWEIYNEPDIPQLFHGTVRDYIHLYSTTARKLRALDASLKISGPVVSTSVTALPLLEEFLDTIKTYNLPLDYIAYHHYNTLNPYNFKAWDDTIKRIATKYGFGNLPTIVSEWSPCNFDYNNDPFTWRDDPYMSASTISALTYFQKTSAAYLMRYRINGWELGLFDGGGNYNFNGLAHKLFTTFRLAPYELQSTGSDSLGTTVLCGTNTNKDIIAISVADNSSSANSYKVGISNMQSGDAYSYTTYRIDSTNYITALSTGFVSYSQPEFMVQCRAPFTDMVILNKVTGINSFNESNGLRVFPNPSSGRFMITWSTKDVEQLQILNTSGQLLRSYDSLFLLNGTLDLDLADEIIPNGVYFLKLFSKGTITTSRITLIH